MRPSPRWTSLAGLAVGAALIVGACSSAASTPTPTDTPAASAAAAASIDSASATATVAGASSLTIGTTNSPTLGQYLTGLNGMTLYVFTKDTAGNSTCTGSCATNWPPLVLAAGATVAPPTGATGKFATIARADGTMQVTYNDMPLYYFAGDSAAGDTTGQGKSGVWFVAPLSGSLPAAATPSATQAPAATQASGY